MANSPQTLTAKLRDYYTLTKPEVNLLILMTTSAGYYLDGTCVGRPDAPHREPASTFGTSQHTRSVSVWPSVERCRRSLSGDHRKFIVSIFGSLDAAVVSADLYAIEAENPAVHAARGIPRGDADFDRMGGFIQRH